MSSLVGHAVSQETKDTKGGEIDYNKSSFISMGDRSKLPHIRSVEYLRGWEKLYYNEKHKDRYGKISTLLNEIVETDNVRSMKQLKKAPSTTTLPMAKREAVKDWIDKKKEGIYCRIGIEEKRKSMEKMHMLIKKEEDDWEKRKRYEEESKRIYGEYIRSEEDDLKKLKEKKMKLEERRRLEREAVEAIEKKIRQEDEVRSKIEKEIEEMETFERFVKLVWKSNGKERIEELQKIREEKDGILLTEANDPRKIAEKEKQLEVTFLDELKQIEDRFVKGMQELVSTEHDKVSQEKEAGDEVDGLEKRSKHLKESMKNMKQRYREVKLEVEEKKQGLEESNTRMSKGEISEEDKKRIFKKIYSIGLSLNICEKNEKGIGYSDAVVLLKKMTMMFDDLQANASNFEKKDKKEYERVTREIAKARRDRLAQEKAVRAEAEQQLKDQEKMQRMIEIERKLQGRRDVYKVWNSDHETDRNLKDARSVDDEQENSEKQYYVLTSKDL